METNSGVSAPYISRPQGHVSGHNNPESSMLVGHFAGMTLGGGMGMPGAAGHQLPVHSPAYILGSDGQFVLAPLPTAQPLPLGHGHDNHYPNYPVTAAGGFGGPYLGLQMPMMPYTPGRPNATQPRIERGHSDVPGLENRRGSYSTTESTPATPFYGGAMAHRENGPRVANLDRSAYTTPSPQHLGLSNNQLDAGPKPFVTITDRALDDLLNEEPLIPKAVPAVFTPPGQMKSVDQSLENRIPGNRNVYIRGLHPTTDDDLLFQFANRFGAVETSKAIIDTGTGACKGFGFAKFFDVRHSEMCIRGFHRLGYEVGFARESFNSRLKAEGDEQSTNLYISNLPKSLTEVELATIFFGYRIQSSKILRDNMGNSRGVGFARFDTREICDDIIQKFNGASLRDEGLIMNIRYADTPSQKELKRVTAERRQFRTNEYNIGAYGTDLVGRSPSMYTQPPAQYRRMITTSRSGISGSSRDCDNATTRSGSQLGHTQTATTTSTDAAISTPTSSECDEGVTIHADPATGAVTDKSQQKSPVVKVEECKTDAQ